MTFPRFWKLRKLFQSNVSHFSKLKFRVTRKFLPENWISGFLIFRYHVKISFTVQILSIFTVSGPILTVQYARKISLSCEIEKKIAKFEPWAENLTEFTSDDLGYERRFPHVRLFSFCIFEIPKRQKVWSKGQQGQTKLQNF